MRSAALVAALVGLVAVAPVARGDAPRIATNYPDLSISIDGTTVSADASTLTISVSVRNVGSASAAPSVARAQGAGVQATPQDTPSLAPNALDTITFTVALPASAQGTTQKVSVSVDPVREPNVDNNYQSSAVAIPKPPQPAPDLAVTIVRAALSSDGGTLNVDAQVQNVGTATSRPTTASAVAFGTTASAQPVPPLRPPSTPVPLHFSFTVPDSARPSTQRVQVSVVPPPGDASTANDLATTSVRIPTRGGKPTPPDLTVAISGTGFGAGGRLLVVQAVARNATAGRAGATTAHAKAGDWGSTSKPVPALAAGSSPARLTFTFQIPDRVRETSQTVTVSLDPAAGETDTANDTVSTNVSIPALPPSGKPDLAVTIVSTASSSDGKTLTVRAKVRNLGSRPAAATSATASARGLGSETLAVPLLAAGARPVLLAFRLSVPRDAGGTNRRVQVVVRPVAGDANGANDRALALAALRRPPSPSHGLPAWAWAALLGGGLPVLSVGIGFGVRRWLRIQWQREATEEEPRERCSGRETHTRKLECKAKPALRKVEKLSLSAPEDEAEEGSREHEVEGPIVDALNRALRWRRLRMRRRSRQTVEPLGEQLAAEIERWLADRGSPLDVSVEAHLKGGKLECEYRRSKCVRDGSERVWKEVSRWKGEVEDEATEPVAMVRVPMEPRPQRLEQLVEALVALVDRIDLPGAEKAPESAPAPHV